MRDHGGEKSLSKTARQLLRRSALSIGLRVAGVALSYLAHILMSRTIGLHDYGLYVILIGWVSVLSVATRLGFDASVVRYGTIYREDENWSALRGLVLVATVAVCGAGLFASAGMAIAGQYFGVGAEELLSAGALLMAISLLGLYSVFTLSVGSVFGSQFYDQVLRPALLILGIAVVTAIARAKLDLGAALAVTAVAAWAALIALTIQLGSMLRQCVRTGGNYSAVHSWFRVSIPLLLVAGIQELFNQAQIISLGLLADARAAALFAAAWRLASLVSFGLAALGVVCGPMVASAFHRGDFHDLRRLTRLAARIAVAFAVPTAIVLIVGGPVLLGLFGSDFRAAYPVLLVLVGGALVNAFTGVVAYLLTLTGRERQALVIFAATLAANIVLNVLLIPLWGAFGAALASATSTMLWNLAMLAYVWQLMGIDASALGLSSRRRTSAFADRTLDSDEAQ